MDQQRRSETQAVYDRERWQIEHTTELQRHRLLSCVAAEHALAMIDGLKAGSFKASAMRQLVGIEQRWKELAHLPTTTGTSTCIENLSNIFVHHLEEPMGSALPWQPSDFLAISGACVAEHHHQSGGGGGGGGGMAQQRLIPLSERHFESYARLLAQLARLNPSVEKDAWYAGAAHVINAAVALGSHLDWVLAIRKK